VRADDLPLGEVDEHLTGVTEHCATLRRVQRVFCEVRQRNVSQDQRLDDLVEHVLVGQSQPVLTIVFGGRRPRDSIFDLSLERIMRPQARGASLRCDAAPGSRLSESHRARWRELDREVAALRRLWTIGC